MTTTTTTTMTKVARPSGGGKIKSEKRTKTDPRKSQMGKAKRLDINAGIVELITPFKTSLEAIRDATKLELDDYIRKREMNWLANMIALKTRELKKLDGAINTQTGAIRRFAPKDKRLLQQADDADDEDDTSDNVTVAAAA